MLEELINDTVMFSISKQKHNEWDLLACQPCIDQNGGAVCNAMIGKKANICLAVFFHPEIFKVLQKAELKNQT